MPPADGMAFVARPAFLAAFAALCGEPFPWQGLTPVTVATPVDPRKEKERFPVLLKEAEPALRDMSVLAVFGSLAQLDALRQDAAEKILAQGRKTGCRYRRYQQDSHAWYDALDRLNRDRLVGCLDRPRTGSRMEGQGL
ncbi:MAG: hypothetical protein HQL63_14560 [Magnetococcales bacterium]|nr:hypothetical protein [Magnetococcales bacterium]